MQIFSGSECVCGLGVETPAAATLSALVAVAQTHIYAACVPKCGSLP